MSRPHCPKPYRTHDAALAALPASPGLYSRAWHCSYCGAWHVEAAEPPPFKPLAPKPGRKPKSAKIAEMKLGEW